VSSVLTPNQAKRRLAAESAALGTGYAAVLVWAGSALVGAFGYSDASPYWAAIPGLRTDTSGALAFAVAAVTLVTSKYLQLRRRGAAPVEREPGSAGVALVQAVAETGAVLGTALVIYLSCNAFMHPQTLQLQLTHLAPWPTEGTVRVTALVICLVAVATRHYLRATASRPSQDAAAVPEKAGLAA
jgi:hypothetical protein